MHCEWSIRALEAGKHVLCEKPMSSSAAEVEEAFAVAERTGFLLTEAFMYRHHPQTKRLAALVAEGAIGDAARDPQRVQLRALRRVEHPPAHRCRRRLADGRRVLLHQRLAPARRASPRRVFGRAYIGPTGTDWAFTGSLRFPGDVLALFDCATCLPDRDELEAIGSEGSLFLDDPWHCLNPVIELRRDDGVERIAVEAANPYRLELEDLGRAIRTGATPLLGRDDAVAQARVIAALRRSAAAGQDGAP